MPRLGDALTPVIRSRRLADALASALRRPGDAQAVAGDSAAASWEAMKRIHAEQAARGVPGAAEGLRRIEQGRWPSGEPRQQPVRGDGPHPHG